MIWIELIPRIIITTNQYMAPDAQAKNPKAWDENWNEFHRKSEISDSIRNGILEIPIAALSKEILVEIVKDLVKFCTLDTDSRELSVNSSVFKVESKEDTTFVKATHASVLTTDHMSASDIGDSSKKCQVTSEKFRAARKMRKCSFCNKTHIWGKNRCSSFGKRCSYCNVLNHSEDACFWKHPELLELNNRYFVERKLRENSGEQQKEEKISDKASESSSQRNSETSKKESEACEIKSLERPEVTAEAETMLKWINDKLKSKYCSLADIKDDKEFRSLMYEILGKENGFSDADDPWTEVIWMLENESHELNYKLLENKDQNEIFKLLNWLKEKDNAAIKDDETEVETKKVDKFHESDEINEPGQYFKVNKKELENWFLTEIETTEDRKWFENKRIRSTAEDLGGIVFKKFMDKLQQLKTRRSF